MQKKNNYNTQILISWWGLFALVAFMVKQQSSHLFNIDQLGLIDIHRFLQPSQLTAFKWITLAGSPIVTTLGALILSGWLLHRKQPFFSLITLTTVIGGDLLELCVKELIQRPRPAFELVRATGYSFPSGHVFGTTMLSVLIWHFVISKTNRSQHQFFLLFLLIYWVGLVAISRVYLQVHFPSDVLGGFILAQAWWQTVNISYLRLEQQIASTINQLTGSDPKKTR
ncbi:phosphatase PAP2 family protein [Lentilactobacillus hilgardii]|uniref:phosphatase PAP2 family protein n=1 Tax=Lentilactobacillus hilgardii TaxID=1588 RepID=UPI0021C42E6B|nr:phosphatase PAP2 family protein [Lentilactobacillus hilgardii]MCP9333152.1 phosphatase PAP2 family protein [Lentilactobacillus hilgardii]MCP9349751.1 phosphatase PAP2 family protein [Lentilactobacillus hilgardii]MCP9352679.1 phosphatase PAP2 family protein [Lentilactobacillus hilgardii]